MASYLDNGLIEYCSGCGACKEICPKQCITMCQQTDGFLFPKVDYKLCINCNKCKSVCPYNRLTERFSVIEVLSGKSRNKSVCKKSSSGGIFYEIASKVIDCGGIVAGAKFDDNYKCVHSIAKTNEELIPLLGSKYVQSNCSVVFPEIEAALREGIQVLFSGTPCQVAGLKNYLGKGYDNLFCIDVACHGVPSAADFEKCKQYLEKKHGGKLTYIRFRDKTRSGWYHSLSYIIERKGKKEEHTIAPYRVPYYYLFLYSKNIRKSCYNCQYIGLERVGDITLADYWRAERVYSAKEIGSGISAVLCNTEKGKRLLEQCSEGCELRVGLLDEVIKSNQPFIGHCKAFDNREEQINSILTDGYKNTDSYIGKKAFIVAAVKAIVPEQVKRMINKCRG